MNGAFPGSASRCTEAPGRPAGVRGDGLGARGRDGLEARGSAAHNVMLRPAGETGDVVGAVLRHHRDIVLALTVGATQVLLRASTRRSSRMYFKGRHQSGRRQEEQAG